MPEILDAWGNPIRFVRWPVGFDSDFVDQNSVAPFDPGRVFSGVLRAGNQGGSFQSVPLIVSPGPDGWLDLALSRGRVYYGDSFVPNDPYVNVGTVNSPLLIGDYYDADDLGTNNATDNIHSHLISTSIR